MQISIRQKLYLCSLIILISNGLLGYAVYNSNQKLLDSEEWVHRTEQVIYRSDKILSLAKDLETASRGFIITNDSAFIEPLYSAKATVFMLIGQLKKLTNNNPLQQQRIDSLNFYMEKRLNFSLKTINIRSEQGLAPAIAYTVTRQGKYYTDHIRQITGAIQQNERVLLEQRKQINQHNALVFNQYLVSIFFLIAGVNILLIIAIGKHLLQDEEREEHAAELWIANEELLFQNEEKGKRAAELVIANKELSYQSGEKRKRAGELVIANKELSFQSDEKEKRAAELVIADEELSYQSGEKEKRAAELVIANKELLFQNKEKEKRAAELVIANVELFYQNKEKENRAAELAIANGELLFQNDEKEKRAAELVIANVELLFQNDEKEKRAGELIIANEELWYQNNEKEKRAAELAVANKELSFQNREKEKRAVELAFANEALLFQNEVRKIAEKNLSQSESRLKEAQAIAHVGNFEIDLVNHSEIWSDEMYKIYGINKKNFTPSKELFLSFVHPDDRDNMTADVNETFKLLKGTTSDFRFIHNDGTTRYAYSEARIELDKNKKPIRLFGILQDVTEIKRADAERTKMLNDLMLRNNDLEQFAYIISHNLRAPVANIIGASSVLNDVDVSDEDKEILNRAINISVMKLDDVVKDLNHILQVKGGINETRELVHFSELVDDIKSSIQGIIKHDVRITHDFSQLNEFLTIKPYLYSIFYNLISNSVKYCRRDIPCSIEIKSQVVNNSLQLIFTDNGMGINLEKNRDQIFGLYRRFHPGIEGKGMGLYMVKTQVEALGGKISIQSTENKGTEFIIAFEV